MSISQEAPAFNHGRKLRRKGEGRQFYVGQGHEQNMEARYKHEGKVEDDPNHSYWGWSWAAAGHPGKQARVASWYLLPPKADGPGA